MIWFCDDTVTGIDKKYIFIGALGGLKQYPFSYPGLNVPLLLMLS